MTAHTFSRSMIATAIVLACGTAAMADTVFVNTNGLGNLSTDGAGNRTLWAAAGGGSTVNAGLGAIGTQLTFGSVVANITATTGTYYRGMVNDLGTNWFDGGDANNTARPANTAVLAFGQGATTTTGTAGSPTTNAGAQMTSNQLTLTFSQGLRAFGFNFDDLNSIVAGSPNGATTGATLRVTYSSGTVQTLGAGSGLFSNAAVLDGFFGVVASGNNLITSVTFLQTPDRNDGFSIHNMQAVVVPLPAPVFGGLAGLAGVGGLVAIRRRRMA
jgi:hypothetical protein